MSQVYIEYDFKISPPQPGTEILIAELGAAGFESFVENENGVQAYIQKSEWREDVLIEIFILKSSEFKITFQQKEIAQVNWNEEWEKNFDPIIVSDQCAVRAPFHSAYNVRYEIVIEPKMSFGTGHHETTYMILNFLLEADVKNQTVLDMGCGTSVLAILASMRGATTIDAIDIDQWCVENSQENIERNNCSHINVVLGDASEISKEVKYDTIIANINRNILLNDLHIYANALKENGALFLSGFYKEDLSIITECCNKLGLKFVKNKERNNWVAAHFIKII
jgi:ribosomal protein L11 methyltransferase